MAPPLDDPDAAPRALRWTVLAVAPALVLAAVQAAWPWPFFSDDAFVTLRYADRLLHGFGLTWTDGERVEGYSNLLWLLGCAGLGALGIDLVAAARLLGAGCTTAALWHLTRALRPHDAASAAAAAVAPLLVAGSGTVMAWTLGGLEGPMVLACLAWGFAALLRELRRAPMPAVWTHATLVRCSIPFALGCWTRPDGPLWVAGAGIALGLAASRSGLRTAVSRTAMFAALPLCAVGAQLVFRFAYYGDLVPNTAYVKAQFDPGSGAQGLAYVTDALASALRGITLPAALGVVALPFVRALRAAWLVLALPTLAWLGYLAAIGGDHFPGFRLLHGALAPMALLAGLLVGASAHRRVALLALLAAAVAAVGDGVRQSRSHPRLVEEKSETWEWRGRVVGETLARAFGDAAPRLAVDAAGAVPYYSRLPALDMLGLCDRTIARTPFRDWLLEVKARATMPLPPGHLRGNGDHVMRLAPDLILMATPPGLPLPVFVSALEFEDDPRFRDRYRCVLVDLGEREVTPGAVERITSPLWVLVHGRVGIRSTPDRIEVPAWLFGSYRLDRPLSVRHLPPPPDTDEGRAIAAGVAAIGAWYYGRSVVAVPDDNGALVLELRAERAALPLRLPAGEWRATVVPADAAVAVRGGDGAAFPGGNDLVIELVRTTAANARVESIVLDRRR